MIYHDLTKWQATNTRFAMLLEFRVNPQILQVLDYKEFGGIFQQNMYWNFR